MKKLLHGADEMENFTTLGKLNISPGFISRGLVILEDGFFYFVTEVERVFGKTLDPAGPELTADEKTKVKELLDELIMNNIYMNDFKPSHVRIGSISRDGMAGPQKGYIVDVSEVLPNHFDNPRELINGYIADMTKYHEEETFNWDNLGTKWGNCKIFGTKIGQFTTVVSGSGDDQLGRFSSRQGS